jgi:hypothetical protein
MYFYKIHPRHIYVKKRGENKANVGIYQSIH